MATPEINENCHYVQNDPHKCRIQLRKFHFDILCCFRVIKGKSPKGGRIRPSLGEIGLTDEYALWLNFRMIDENILHRMSWGIGSIRGGITLQIKNKAEIAGAFWAYIYLIMDAQLNIQDEVFNSAMY